MTRTALLLCTAVLLAVGFGMLTSVEAQPLNASQFCHANGDFGLGLAARREGVTAEADRAVARQKRGRRQQRLRGLSSGGGAGPLTGGRIESA